MIMMMMMNKKKKKKKNKNIEKKNKNKNKNNKNKEKKITPLLQPTFDVLLCIAVHSYTHIYRRVRMPALAAASSPTYESFCPMPTMTPVCRGRPTRLRNSTAGISWPANPACKWQLESKKHMPQKALHVADRGVCMYLYIYRETQGDWYICQCIASENGTFLPY